MITCPCTPDCEKRDSECHTRCMAYKCFEYSRNRDYDTRRITKAANAPIHKSGRSRVQQRGYVNSQKELYFDLYEVTGGSYDTDDKRGV